MVNRIGGLASGMDIDSIVAKLMQAEKAPLNKLYKQKQTYEWQRDAYRDVNKELKAFDDFLSKEMTLQRDFWKKNASSSNEAVKVSASAGANGTMTIDAVKQLAKNTTIRSDKEGLQKTQTVSELTGGAISGTKDIKLKVLQNDGTLKDVTVQVNGSDTLETLTSKLSKNTGLNVFHDDVSGKMSITTNASGAGADYETTGLIDEAGPATVDNTFTTTVQTSLVVEDGMELFTALGFGTDKVLDNANEGGLVTKGQNAVLTVNGLDIERSSNDFTINGFNISLQDTYNEDGAAKKPISLNVSTDVDGMVDQIKKFVDTYNGLIDSLNAKTKETKYRDYQPLTDEEKEEMSEDQIKKWEEKAKSGLLRRDSLITNGLSDMRNVIYSKGGSANAQFDTLHEMGITTTSSYLDGGKLQIDEDKLRKALTEDPEAVVRTFTNTVPKGETGQEGIVQQLRNSISKTTLNIEKKAGKTTSTEHNYAIGKNLLGIDDRIDAWKRRLENAEERYWKQFTAMETAINKANQQSASLFAGQTQ